MASRERYLQDLNARANEEGFELRPVRPRRRWSFVDSAVALLALVIVFVACVWLSKNTDVFGAAQTLVSSQPVRPTERPMSQPELDRAKYNAPATAAEQQVIATPVPVAPAGDAPGYVVLDVPVEQQAVNNIQGPAPTLPPVPTAESVLTAEQQAAAAASEEQNYLNSVQSTLTQAQQSVQVYEAENNAETEGQ